VLAINNKKKYKRRKLKECTSSVGDEREMITGCNRETSAGPSGTAEGKPQVIPNRYIISHLDLVLTSISYPGLSPSFVLYQSK
jgi:hypothetical protein